MKFSRGAIDVPKVRWGWLIILAFLIQLATIPTITDPTALDLKRAVLAITAVMMVVGIVSNLRLWTMRLLGIGFILNAVVIVANGGLMPATPENYQRIVKDGADDVPIGQSPPHTKNILLARSDTRLSFLSDTVYISVPSPNVYSPGDLVLIAGVIAFPLEVTRRSARRRGEDSIEPDSQKTGVR